MSTLYQISTSSALVEGVYSGSVCSSVLLEHGDFGLGTLIAERVWRLRMKANCSIQ
jgi:acetolactate decarboxylase